MTYSRITWLILLFIQWHHFLFPTLILCISLILSSWIFPVYPKLRLCMRLHLSRTFTPYHTRQQWFLTNGVWLVSPYSHKPDLKTHSVHYSIPLPYLQFGNGCLPLIFLRDWDLFSIAFCNNSISSLLQLLSIQFLSILCFIFSHRLKSFHMLFSYKLINATICQFSQVP